MKEANGEVVVGVASFQLSGWRNADNFAGTAKDPSGVKKSGSNHVSPFRPGLLGVFSPPTLADVPTL